MHLACREGGIELNAVVENTLFTHESCSVFLTTRNDVHTVCLLVVERSTEETVLRGTIDGEILVEVVADRSSDFAPPIGVGTIVLSTTGTTELIGSQDGWLVLLEVEGDVAVVSDVRHTCCTRTLLRRDENHTVGTTSTIDGSRTCILQHGDGLHVLRSDVAKVATSNTVNHDERTIACHERTRTTNLEVGHGVWVGIG